SSDIERSERSWKFILMNDDQRKAVDPWDNPGWVEAAKQYHHDRGDGIVDARQIFAKTTREANGACLSFSPFKMDLEKGLFITFERRRGKEEWKEDVWLSSPFEILGRVRDPQSNGWARLLRWNDDDEIVHQYSVADE